MPLYVGSLDGQMLTASTSKSVKSLTHQTGY